MLRSWSHDRAVKGTAFLCPLLDSGARKETIWLEGRCGWLCCRTATSSSTKEVPTSPGEVFPHFSRHLAMSHCCCSNSFLLVSDPGVSRSRAESLLNLSHQQFSEVSSLGCFRPTSWQCCTLSAWRALSSGADAIRTTGHEDKGGTKACPQRALGTILCLAAVSGSSKALSARSQSWGWSEGCDGAHWLCSGTEVTDNREWSDGDLQRIFAGSCVMGLGNLASGPESSRTAAATQCPEELLVCVASPCPLQPSPEVALASPASQWAELQGTEHETRL